MKIRLLAQKSIRQILSMSEAIHLMEEAHIALTRGTIETPLRTNISTESGTLLYKPAFLESSNTFGIKVVSVFPGNSDCDLPVTSGVMLVNDGETGLPLALMDANYLTALRTGATAGLATRLLANPDTKTAALFGTGGQAECQLLAMLEVLPLETVHVFSRKVANAEDFCKRFGDKASGCHLRAAASRDVLKSCGLIVAATNSCDPVFADSDVASGTHINGIGSFQANMREVPSDTVSRSAVFVEQRSAALQEAGDIVRPIAEGVLPKNFAPTELGEVLLDSNLGRRNDKQITFFKSVGNAAQDIVCAREILATAEREGIGQLVEV